jgi:hypothetical protein
MFAKIQQFRAVAPRRAVAGAVTPTRSNDNRITGRGAAAPRPSRPVLACHWRPGAGGRLECHWGVEIADGSATADADQRWIIVRLSRLFGIGTAGGRRMVAAFA